MSGPAHPFFRKPAARSKNSARLLLVDLQSPINIGMILRVAETYRVKIGVHDPRGVLQNPDKVKTIGDFACGALERQGYGEGVTLTDLARLRRTGRIVAATIDKKATPSPRFDFQIGDIILLGNEYDGLPAAFAEASDVSLHIPMADVWTPKPPSNAPIDPTRIAPVANDGKPNLNVAMSAGIICYEAFLARGRALGSVAQR